MTEMTYLDFDLEIERAAGKKYRAQVLGSSAGQATAEFRLPFSDLELENLTLRMGHTRGGVRRIESPEMEAAKTFGGRLFDAVFAGDVRACLRSSLDEAGRQGKGLRLRLRLTKAPDLADIPWEYVYNTGVNRFLVLSAETPLVRYLDLPERIQPLKVKPPLRILVMISSPSDYPTLDVEQEWTRVRDALQNLTAKGRVTVDRLEQATLAALQRQLRQTQYHVFHFIGHGGFDQTAQDGVLLLEDETGKGRQVSGNYLGTLLHDERTLRLAVLNACEGARTSRTDPFAGTAQSLVQQGIPAVIAMQFAISDTAAITFATEFYTAIADSYPDCYPVDAAVAEARKAIFAQGNDVEWGTPVLYMRSPDGQIFDVESMTAEEQEKNQIAVLLRDAEAALTAKDWPTVIDKLQAILSLEPNHAQATAKLAFARQQQEAAKVTTTPAATRKPLGFKLPGCQVNLMVQIIAAVVVLAFISPVVLLGLQQYVASPAATPSPGGVPRTVLPAAATSTRVPAPALTATPIQLPPTRTLTPSPSATPRLSPILVCREFPVRGFGQVWYDHAEAREYLGCLSGNETSMDWIGQRFENGLIFSTAARNTMIVLFRYNMTILQVTVAADAKPDAIERPPTGRFAPQGRIGYVWQQVAGVRTRLGWAIETEKGGKMADDSGGAWQSYNHGVMYWIPWKQPDDKYIYVLATTTATGAARDDWLEFKDTWK